MRPRQVQRAILAHSLDISELEAIGILTVFRESVAEHRPDGDLTGLDPSEVAYLGLSGATRLEPLKVYEALRAAQVLAGDGAHIWVPHWIDQWAPEATLRRLSRELCRRERVSLARLRAEFSTRKPWLNLVP